MCACSKPPAARPRPSWTPTPSWRPRRTRRCGRGCARSGSMGQGMSVEEGNPGQRLHDRATRGLPLTKEEWTQLTDWYAALDRDEVFVVPDGSEVESLLSLQAEVRSG